MDAQQIALAAFNSEEQTRLLVGGVCKLNPPNSGRDDVDLVMSHWQLRMALDAIHVAFAHSASPIERQFLCALVLGFIFADPRGYIVTTPQPDVIGHIAEVRELLSLMDEIDAAHGAKRGSKQGFYAVAESDEARSAYVQYRSLWMADAIHLTPQAGLTLGSGKRIRLDFLAWVPSNPKSMLAIECDGFEWHSSRKSFAGDRARDRELKLQGIDTIRFAGTEIHNDLAGISHQAVSHLLKLTSRGGAE